MPKNTCSCSLTQSFSLRVSVATFATLVTIHADADTANSETTIPDDDKGVDIPKATALNYLPQKTPPSPTTAETLRSSSVTSVPQEKAVVGKVVGINRVDTILLPRYVTSTTK